MPNPYIVFAGDTYYPEGGTKDYRGSFSSHLEAMQHIANHKYDWWQVAMVDRDGRLIQLGDGHTNAYVEGVGL